MGVGAETKGVPAEWAATEAFARIGASLDEVLANLPNRAAALFLRAVTLPGGSHRGPSDALTRECAELLLSPSPTRDRLTAGVRAVAGRGALATLEEAFEAVTATDRLRRKLREAGMSADEAMEKGVLAPGEADALRRADDLVARAIAVDDFDPAEIGAVREREVHRDAAE